MKQYYCVSVFISEMVNIRTTIDAKTVLESLVYVTMSFQASFV